MLESQGNVPETVHAAPAGADWHADGRAWNRYRIAQPEAFSEFSPRSAVQVTQFDPGLRASLIYAYRRGILIASGHIGTRLALRGALAEGQISLGLGLNMATGSRLWLRSVTTGCVAIYEPGEEVDGVYDAGALYLRLSLRLEDLDAEAEREGVALPLDMLRSGVSETTIDPGRIGKLSAWFLALHEGRIPALPPGERPEEAALAALLDHLAGHNAIAPTRFGPGSFERIVGRARAYIEAAIQNPLSIDLIARAAGTSRRTLNRAFAEVLNETPRAYVMKLRLQRIRDELAGPGEALSTVTTVSHRWGVPELGRLAARYHEMFGEKPSQTLLRRRGADWRELHVSEPLAPMIGPSC